MRDFGLGCGALAWCNDFSPGCLIASFEDTFYKAMKKRFPTLIFASDSLLSKCHSFWYLVYQ